MIAENFIAQQWFNSLFSELDNFELVQNPIEDWFLSNTATAKKRLWLFTDQWTWWAYNWQTDWEIMWKKIIWWLAYFWDDQCKVYKFEKAGNSFSLTKIYDNPDGLVLKTEDLYWNKIKQKAISISYVSTVLWSWTADDLLSTNDDWNWNVRLVVNEAGTFSAASVWQYIYMTNQASDSAKYQIRQIVEYIDDKTVFLSEMFYADPTTRDSNEPWETYESIDTNIVFNNLRTADNLVLTIDNNDNAYFRNLWWNDIEIFEWRFRYINSYWSAVWWSMATWEYEILDPSTILWSSADWRWQKMNSLVLTKSYLLVNQETSMSVVWQIAATSASTAIYNLNSIINWDSALTPESIHYKWWLYYLWKDRLFQWWDIVAVSTNMIYWETKNQWMVIQKYLNQIEDWSFVRTYDYGRWPIIQYVQGWRTTMLVYDQIYQGRLVRKYNMEIYDMFETFYWETIIWVWDKVCLRKWNSDLWQDIHVKCVVTWSKTNFVDSLFSLKKIKMSLWYYENVVKFKMKLDLWWSVFETKVEKDANWVEYLTWQNMAASNSSMWWIPLWFWNVWWGNWLSSFINKVWLIWIPIWKKCWYYKLTLENIDNFDLNIVSITMLLEWWNIYVTPSANVF